MEGRSARTFGRGMGALLFVWGRSGMLVPIPAGAGLEQFEHCFGGVGERLAAPVEQIQIAGHVQLANLDLDQQALFDLPAHAHARHDRHADIHLHEALDAFDGGELDAHVQRDVMLGEELNDALAKRRFHDVGNKAFLTQFGELGAAALREAMFGRNDQGKLIAKDFYRGELRLLGDERRDAEIQAIVQQFRGDIAGKRAAHGQMDLRIKPAIAGQDGQQRVDGAFVDAKGKFAATTGAEVVDGAADFIAQVQNTFGITDQEPAGVGKLAGAGAAGEEGFADFVFQLADGDADGGLGTVELLGGAGEAALAGDGEEDVEFGEVHNQRRSPGRACATCQLQPRRYKNLRLGI
jgi:hypothetical protein